MPHPVYTVPELDQIFSGIATRISVLEAHVKALEDQKPIPPIEPPPVVTPPPVTPPQAYKPTSSWNTKVVNPKLTDVAALHAGGWINAGDYGVPVVFTDTTSPVVTVQCPASWGWPATTLTFHIPASASGATGTDGSMVIIDGPRAYDFWQFNRQGSTAHPAAWAQSDLVNGTGWGNKATGQAAGIHATGSALLAGLIVGSELKTGFNHALAVAVRRNISSSQFVGEAIHSDGDGGPIPEGARLAIPASTPMTVTSQPGMMMWKAMVEYGAFVIDVADGNQALYFWADPVSTDPKDLDILLGPSWTAAELGKIAAAVRLVG